MNQQNPTGKILIWSELFIFFVPRSHKIFFLSINILTTFLSAACPVRHSFDGGDSLNSATIHGHSDGCFGHDRLIHLNYIFKKKDVEWSYQQTDFILLEL